MLLVCRQLRYQLPVDGDTGLNNHDVPVRRGEATLGSYLHLQLARQASPAQN